MEINFYSFWGKTTTTITTTATTIRSMKKYVEEEVVKNRKECRMIYL